MERPAHITPKHIQHGKMMREIVQSDIATKGLSFESAVEGLAGFLSIQVESVKLGIAIANEWAA